MIYIPCPVSKTWFGCKRKSFCITMFVSRCGTLHSYNIRAIATGLVSLDYFSPHPWGHQLSPLLSGCIRRPPSTQVTYWNLWDGCKQCEKTLPSLPPTFCFSKPMIIVSLAQSVKVVACVISECSEGETSVVQRIISTRACKTRHLASEKHCI